MGRSAAVNKRLLWQKETGCKAVFQSDSFMEGSTSSQG